MGYSRGLIYYKLILKKVSFDSTLFHKELQKAYDNLDNSEVLLLNNWVLSFLKQNPQLNNL
mgnify:CR=1 FL=1